MKDQQRLNTDTYEVYFMSTLSKLCSQNAWDIYFAAAHDSSNTPFLQGCETDARTNTKNLND